MLAAQPFVVIESLNPPCKLPLDLLHELDKHEDVRPVLNEKFRLKQALDDISSGRPFSGRHQQIDEQQQQQQQQEHASSSVAVAN